MARERKFGGLAEKAKRLDKEEPPRIGSGGDAAEGPSTRQYGRRAAGGYSQINANIRTELKREVQKRLIDEDRTLQELVEELLEEYLQRSSG